MNYISMASLLGDEKENDGLNGSAMVEYRMYMAAWVGIKEGIMHYALLAIALITT